MVEVINLDTSPSHCGFKMGGRGDDSIQQSTLFEHTAVPAEESLLELSSKAGRLSNAGNRLVSFGITTENSGIDGSKTDSCKALVNNRKVDYERPKDEVDDPSAGKFQAEKNNESSLVESRVLEHMQHDAEGSRRVRIFPPPLSSLARKSSSQFPCQMPLVALQPIRSHGRFVLQELKVPRQLMFQPIRTNGRLILQLKWHENEEDAQHGKQLLPLKSNVEKSEQDCETEAKELSVEPLRQDGNPTDASPSLDHELYGESNALKQMS